LRGRRRDADGAESLIKKSFVTYRQSSKSPDSGSNPAGATKNSLYHKGFSHTFEPEGPKCHNRVTLALATSADEPLEGACGSHVSVAVNVEIPLSGDPDIRVPETLANDFQRYVRLR
jgi:hypothetical protein